MTFNGWAFALNGVAFTTCTSQTDWDDTGCFPLEIVDALTDTADGLGLPGLRTEDVTYYQRDGVKHFSDWYEPRVITLVGTIGPDTTCACDTVAGCGCTTTRQQLQDAVQAWKRSCCDTELVIYTDCHQMDLVDGVNVYPDGSFEVDADGWTGDTGVTVARVTSPVQTGSGSLQISWDTDATNYGKKAVGPALTGLTVGARVRLSAWLYGATGGPDLVLAATDSAAVDVVFSDPIPADDAWHFVTVDFYVGDLAELVPAVYHATGSTSGDLSYVDDVEVQHYTGVDRAVNGPFGVVGRPTEFRYKPRYHNEKIFDFVAAFRAVDQRLYVLDECGTPGYTSCVQIDPGTQLMSVCFEDGTGDYTGTQVMCFGSGGFCFTTPVTSDVSVPATAVEVGGTEKVNPEIVFYPPFQDPYAENITTGEYVWLEYTQDSSGLPVTLNTEDGTAFDAEGNSLTHLLRGTLFLSMYPGNYEWRYLTAGEVFPSETGGGYATLCFRDTVLNA